MIGRKRRPMARPPLRPAVDEQRGRPPRVRNSRRRALHRRPAPRIQPRCDQQTAPARARQDIVPRSRQKPCPQGTRRFCPACRARRQACPQHTMQGSKRRQWAQGQACRFEAGGDPAPRSRRCCRRARASSSTHQSRAQPNTKGGQTSNWAHFPPRFQGCRARAKQRRGNAQLGRARRRLRLSRPFRGRVTRRHRTQKNRTRRGKLQTSRGRLPRLRQKPGI